MSLAVLAYLTQAGEERDDWGGGERCPLWRELRKLAYRLRRLLQGCVRKVSLTQLWNHEAAGRCRWSWVTRCRAGQSSRPRLLRHLGSSGEWRWIRIVSGQPWHGRFAVVSTCCPQSQRNMWPASLCQIQQHVCDSRRLRGSGPAATMLIPAGFHCFICWTCSALSSWDWGRNPHHISLPLMMMSSNAASKRLSSGVFISAASPGFKTRAATKYIYNQRIPLIHKQLTFIRTDAWVSPGSVIPGRRKWAWNYAKSSSTLKRLFVSQNERIFKSGEIEDMAVVM